MTKSLSDKDIKEYVEKHILKMGFKKIIGENNYRFGDIIPHNNVYYVMIREIDYLINSYEVEVTEAKTDIGGNIYRSSTLMTLYITRVIANETDNEKIIKTNKFLNNISNIDNIRNYMLKIKLKKIILNTNGRLGTEI